MKVKIKTVNASVEFREVDDYLADINFTYDCEEHTIGIKRWSISSQSTNLQEELELLQKIREFLPDLMITFKSVLEKHF